MMLESLKQGFNTTLSMIKQGSLIRRSAIKAWGQKAIYCAVERPKQFFNKKRLRRNNADKIYEGFRLKFLSSGVLLTRRSIVLPPELCVKNLNDSFEGEARFFLLSREEVEEAKRGCYVPPPPPIIKGGI